MIVKVSARLHLLEDGSDDCVMLLEGSRRAPNFIDFLESQSWEDLKYVAQAVLLDELEGRQQ